MKEAPQGAAARAIYLKKTICVDASLRNLQTMDQASGAHTTKIPLQNLT
jgi:hypothetical protein